MFIKVWNLLMAQYWQNQNQKEDFKLQTRRFLQTHSHKQPCTCKSNGERREDNIGKIVNRKPLTNYWFLMIVAMNICVHLFLCYKYMIVYVCVYMCINVTVCVKKKITKIEANEARILSLFFSTTLSQSKVSSRCRCCCSIVENC